MSNKNSLFWLLLIVLVVLALSVSCGVKKEKLMVGRAYINAKTLNRAEILDLFDKFSQQYDTVLVKKVVLSFSAESMTQKKREKLPTVSGVMALKRQGDLRLQIFAPVLKTTMAEVAARDGLFEIWFPKKRTLYKGKIGDDLQKVPLTEENDDDKSPRHNISKLRPWHITNTFFHTRLGTASSFLIIEEDTPMERYYVLHELGAGSSGEPLLLQKLWFDRATLKIRKKILYSMSGTPISKIVYRNYSASEKKSFPREVFLDRPLEGYKIHFKLDRIQPNAVLNDDMFQLTIPRNAKIVQISSEEEE